MTIISIRMGIQILEGTRKLHSLRISIILSRSKIEKKAKISEKSELQLVLLVLITIVLTQIAGLGTFFTFLPMRVNSSSRGLKYFVTTNNTIVLIVYI